MTSNTEGLLNGDCRNDLLILDSIWQFSPTFIKNDAELVYNYAYCLGEERRYYEAILMMNSYVKKFPKDLDARLKLGSYYLSVEHFDLGLEELNFIRRINDKYPLVNFNLGVYYSSKKKYKKALEHFDREDELNKSAINYELDFLRGDALVNLNRWDEAEAIFSTIPIREFSYPDAVNYSFVQLQFENFNKAEEIMLNYALQDKQNSDVFNSLAQIAMYSKGYDRAAGYLRLSNKRDNSVESNSWHFILKADLYNQLGYQDSCCITIKILKEFSEFDNKVTNCCD